MKYQDEESRPPQVTCINAGNFLPTQVDTSMMAGKLPDFEAGEISSKITPMRVLGTFIHSMDVVRGTLTNK